MQRRKFLGYLSGAFGIGAAGTAWWLSVSHHRAAAWTRRLIQEARRPVVPSPAKPRPAEWSDNDLTLSWLGHATVLVNFYGVRILTDPALANYVGISLGIGTAGPKRYIAPALGVAELPKVDLVLLSHAHMDHFDLPTLRGMPAETAVVTASATADLLKPTRLRKVTELGWGGRTTIGTGNRQLEIEAFEVRHWGQRWPSEHPRGYNGYVLRREGKAILFGGDTALTPHFSEVRSKGPFAVGIMPIGAYNPWIWNHCNPEQALEMANAAGSEFMVPIHHQTFRLSEEPMNEPIDRLKAALDREPERLALSRVGETFVCPRA